MSSTRIDEEVEKAADYIKRGQVLLYPADTLWAMTCDIDNQAAVERIKKIKQDDVKGNLILTVDSIDMLKRYIVSIHPRIETLLLYHDKPLSIIYDAPNDMQDYLVNDKGTIAIRIVKDSFSSKLISYLDKALISTTACLTDKNVLTAKHEDIPKTIKKEVDYIVDLKSIKTAGLPSILARYNHKGALEFVRK